MHVAYRATGAFCSKGLGGWCGSVRRIGAYHQERFSADGANLAELVAAARTPLELTACVGAALVDRADGPALGRATEGDARTIRELLHAAEAALGVGLGEGEELVDSEAGLVDGGEVHVEPDAAGAAGRAVELPGRLHGRLHGRPHVGIVRSRP
jgi:hypothetical protein